MRNKRIYISNHPLNYCVFTKIRASYCIWKMNSYTQTNVSNYYNAFFLKLKNNIFPLVQDRYDKVDYLHE